MGGDVDVQGLDGARPTCWHRQASTASDRNVQASDYCLVSGNWTGGHGDISSLR